jgi:methanogenic corrinoid protein MtbC1
MQRPGPGVLAYGGASAAVPSPAWPGKRASAGVTTIHGPSLAVKGTDMPAARRYAVEAPAVQAAATQAVDDGVLELATLCMGEDQGAVRRHIAACTSGHSPQSICLELLAPAARYLGELWDEDLCSFTDVTIGLMRLQDVLRGLTEKCDGDVPQASIPRLQSATGPGRHSIALATVPGDQHRFGLHMVGALFQEAGWTVTVVPDSTLPDLGALIRRDWFGVLGFSVGTGVRLDRLAAMIGPLREVSRNRGLGILVGGPVFLENPQLAAQLGADGTASDGVAAIKLAENLLARGSLCG